MTDIVERLRSNATLNVCPFDKLSPEYYKTPSDKPCKFCGGEPEGPNKCTGADLRVMKEAADTIQRLRAELAAVREQEPVAWRCKDFADGWILYNDYADAFEYEHGVGCAMQPLYAAPVPADEHFKTFELGQHVRKKSGSEWEGRVVGWYSTQLTPEGYAVESDAHSGSVQIYPVKALEAVDHASNAKPVERKDGPEVEDK